CQQHGNWPQFTF
nr:immunoglobulin light chain junction region [Macaca mulatta]